MNELGIALLWCVFQVTLLSLLAAGFYATMRRFGPRVGALVALTGVSLVIVLTLLAFSPWPRWSLASEGNADAPTSRVSSATESPPSSTITDLEQASPPGEAGVETGPAPEFASRSSLADFWHAILEEVPRSPDPAVKEDRLAWPTAVAGMALLGATLGVVRLFVGMIAVTRYRLESVSVKEPRITEILDVLLAELGCRRRPEMRESDAFFSAAAVGWRRPVILLPTTWRKWSDQQLRAVLAHEITHIQSNDFLACLLAQIGLALHFYHPLVHWLVARLRLEQELAADAVAAELTGGRHSYLTTLAAMALDQEDRNVVWPARAFLPAKTAFLRRIVVLRNSHRPARAASATSRAVAVACMILAGIFVAGLRPPAASQAIAQQPGSSDEEVPSAPGGVIDLSYVPGDAVVVAAIRPAAILERARQLGLNKMAELLVEQGSPFNVTLEGFEPDEVEQLTAFTDWSGGGEHVLVRTMEPVRLAEVVPAQAELKRVEGMTYFRARWRSYFQLDDRTIAVCPHPNESTFPPFFSQRAGDGPAFLSEEAWTPETDDLVVVAVNSEVIGAAVTEAGGAVGHSPTFVEFFRTPPHGEVKSAFLALQLRDRLSARATLSCKSDTGAAQVKKTLEAYSVIGQNLIVGQIARVADMGNVQEVCDEFFESIETVQEGSQVRATGEIRAEKDWGVRFAEQIAAAQAASRGAKSANNLKLLGIGMHNYHDTYKAFPSAVLYGPDGKTPYSWRVAILPFIGEGPLYDRYRFDEPWDGPNNRKLLAEMPTTYRHPSAPIDSQHASYFGLVGPGTVFDGEEASRIKDIMDGTSNTLMLVEAEREIPWTKPEDIPYEPDRPIPSLGFSERGFLAALCDGSVRFIRGSAREGALRLLITKADRTPIDFSEL